MQRALPFVIVVGLVAAAAAAVVAVRVPGPVTSEHLYAALILAAAGVGAEMLNYEHVKGGVSGSISLIPFCAAALCAPNWLSVASLATGCAVVQVLCKRHWIKGAFNVVQMVLGLCLAILVYRAAGGMPVLDYSNLKLLETARLAFFPAALLVATTILVNTATVSGVLAVVQQRSALELWKAAALPTAPLIALTTFVTFYLAWLYSALGPVGAAGFAIPLLGVRQLYRNTIELTKVTEELLDLMVAAIEARDPYTSGHSERVSKASRIIAKAIGLRPGDVERVGVAALLHDVGKIDEAFAPILAKEGRLTPEEWETMKRHPIRSAELVGLLSSLKDVVGAVRHHHENWDGTGYPDGLKGAAIPQASRIIMFADTLDAMTSDRPYRKALSMDEAKAEIIKFRGRQFDPSICDRIIEAEVWQELYKSYLGAAETRVAESKAS
jgi:HD-GYP domain-containing protein (c-di-GMP phosphodiesterase class II)